MNIKQKICIEFKYFGLQEQGYNNLLELRRALEKKELIDEHCAEPELLAIEIQASHYFAKHKGLGLEVIEKAQTDLIDIQEKCEKRIGKLEQFLNEVGEVEDYKTLQEYLEDFDSLHLDGAYYDIIDREVEFKEILAGALEECKEQREWIDFYKKWKTDVYTFVVRLHIIYQERIGRRRMKKYEKSKSEPTWISDVLELYGIHENDDNEDKIKQMLHRAEKGRPQNYVKVQNATKGFSEMSRKILAGVSDVTYWEACETGLNLH